MNFSVAGKVIVITGGSGAIGSSLAKNFVEQGAKVVLLNRNQSKIDQVANNLKAISHDVLGIACDVLNVDQLTHSKDQILRRFGKIDVLINAAGGNTKGATQSENQSIFDLKIPDIDEAIDLNLKGAVYPSLIFGSEIAKAGSGTIINISSMATYSSISRVMGYSVAKAGINTFTKWMASEMAMRFGDKVRVNAIAPGFFIGEQNRQLLINPDGSLTERSKKIINKTPMRRFGDIQELSGIIQFLCSNEASFITGVVIPVDGGFSTFSGV